MPDPRVMPTQSELGDQLCWIERLLAGALAGHIGASWMTTGELADIEAALGEIRVLLEKPAMVACGACGVEAYVDPCPRCYAVHLDA